MSSPSQTFNWFATGLCAVLAAKGAVVIGRKSSHIFAVLALFSLCWALLLPYYSPSVPAELFSGFSGFVLICVGLLLVRRRTNVSSIVSSGGSFRQWISGYEPVALAERAALALLLVLVTSLWQSHAAAPKIALVTATVLTIIGYYTVCKGIQFYADAGKEWRYLAGIAVPYASAELVYTIYELLRGGSVAMPPFFLIVFGIFKLVFTLVFVFLIAKKHITHTAGDRPITEFFNLIWQIIVVVILLPGHNISLPGADEL